MIIPREGDKVRLYIQITDKSTIDPSNWRADKAKMGPEKILQVAKKTFYPYSISAKSFDWWTIYGSMFYDVSDLWKMQLIGL